MTPPAGLRCAFIALATFLLVASGAVAAQVAANAEIEGTRSDLDEVKRRIRDLQKEIADTEASRSGVSDELAAAERAVSRVQRRLRKLSAERAAAEKTLAQLEGELQALEERIGARQGELGDWLRRHYVHGVAGGVAPFLSARDPSQLARDAHYLEHLGKARLALIESLRTDLEEKARLGDSIAARRDRLVVLETEQMARREELEEVETTRKTALAALGEQLRIQRATEQNLRQDEQRLGRLVAALARRGAERDAARAAARAAADGTARRDGPSGSSGGPGSRSEPVVGAVRQAAGPTPTGVRFADLRGKMRFPVRGELVGRFGAPRAEGGTSWRGVFIRARGGDDVRAVAGGEVVFSDWLRGYGNLIIVDHGDDYLSIYGNNDALFREVGEPIGGGDPIASVGASGGGSESGLYFEIRHKGQPLDPLKWVRLN